MPEGESKVGLDQGEGAVMDEPRETPEPKEAATETSKAETPREEAPETRAGKSDAERLAEAEAEISRLKDAYLRSLAEVENTRRRAARDREDAGKYAVSEFARDLLSVADNLRRALDAVDPEARRTDEALDRLVAGVELTEKTLLDALARRGITPIDAEGRPFDPHVHEAMFEIPDESVANGTVVQVLERGFMIHERPLRPARVAVSRGGPRPAAADAKPEAAEGAGVEPQNASAASYGENRKRQGAETGGTVDEEH